jgi:hypothetical protein
MSASVCSSLLLAVALAAPLFLIAPTAAAVASGASVAAYGGGSPLVEAQVQNPIPNFDFNPTKWVQDAFAALLQSFTDGIRAGMDAVWAANFITQTPQAVEVNRSTVERVCIRCVEEGVEAALRPRPSRQLNPRKLDGIQVAAASHVLRARLWLAQRAQNQADVVDQ